VAFAEDISDPWKAQQFAIESLKGEVRWLKQQYQDLYRCLGRKTTPAMTATDAATQQNTFYTQPERQDAGKSTDVWDNGADAAQSLSTGRGQGQGQEKSGSARLVTRPLGSFGSDGSMAMQSPGSARSGTVTPNAAGACASLGSQGSSAWGPRINMVQRDTTVVVVDGPTYQVSATPTPRDDKRDQKLDECVEKQQALDSKVKALVKRLDESQAGTNAMEGGLKGMVQDVKLCLHRCELLLQVPQIREFVKAFQKSSDTNAVLMDDWKGGGGGTDGGASEKGSTHTKASHRESARSKGTRKSAQFRSVDDWGRPHTPIECDPQPLRTQEEPVDTITVYLPDNKPPKRRA